MQRFSDHAVRRVEPFSARIAGLGVAATLLVLAVLPALASAATQTLKVEKAGTGTGTVTSSPAGFIECGSTCSAPVPEGTKIVLTGAPGANTAAVKWSGCPGENLEGQCIVTMGSAPKTITATFNLLERPLTVTVNGSGSGTVTSSPAGINCATGTACKASFVKGTTVTLAGAPGPNTLPPVWMGCDGSDAEGKCVVSMSAARSVTVTFNALEHPLTVSKEGSGAGTVASTPGGIACGATCSASFVAGASVTLTATPGLHTKPVQWFGCESTLGNTCEVTMTAARSVIAVFALERQYAEYPVSLGIKGTGRGSVTSSPSGIECPEDCAQSYLFNTQVTLSAVAASGSEFDHWSVPSCGSAIACSTTIRASRKVNAIFIAVGKRKLTVSKAGTGAGAVTSKPTGIECGNACRAEFDASVTARVPTKVLLKAKPDNGSKFVGWSGGSCEGKKRSCRVAMNEARNVTATFEKTSPSSSPGTLIVISAKAKGGKVLARVFCSGGTCAGTLKLIARIHNPQGQVKGLVIAKIPFSLAAGASKTLKVKLGSRPLALLRSQGRLRLRATGDGVEGRGLSLRRS